jgi:CheY-like chemotaxis protein
MKRVLMVDDDPVLLRMYQQGLRKHDLLVETAADGLSAVNSLRSSRPDLAVIDLMMPRLSGVDVLRFIRSNKELAELPVVVLCNSYMNELGQEAISLGSQRVLLKLNCSPTKLARVIQDVIAGKPGTHDMPTPSELDLDSMEPAPTKAVPSQAQAQPTESKAPQGSEPVSSEAEFKSRARHDLIQHGPATCIVLRTLCRGAAGASNQAERTLRLEELYQKVHFLTAAASVAENVFMSQMGSALEALLFELLAKPSQVTPSVIRTVVSTVDFIVLLFNHAEDPSVNVRVSGETLVVDDDPLSTRMILAALSKAGLRTRSTHDSLQGLQWAEQQTFALVLLDIEMPNMDGFEFARRLRSMPGYRNTPVVFVTSHSDFETRAKSLLTGADDLIAKPVSPMELAVKAVGHLLRRQLPD